MDMYDNDMYGNDTYRHYRPRNSMARAAFILGILSVMFSSIFYIALPCGALAILCAVLSRTDAGGKMTARCRFAVISGLCGIVATLVITGVMVQKVFTDPALRSYIEYYLRSYTGDYDLDLDEELADLFPFLQNGDSAADTPEEEEMPDDPAGLSPVDPQDSEGVFL